MPDPALFKARQRQAVQILERLRDPKAHFPPQKDGDLVENVVCSLFIAEKLEVRQPTCGAHLKILGRAGLLRSKRIKHWVSFKRDEDRINEFKKLFNGDW